MMNVRLCVITAAIFVYQCFAADSTLVQQSSLVLQVGDRDTAAQKAIVRAESVGGWLLCWNEWKVSLRVPSGELRRYLASLDSIGLKVDETFSSQDQGAEIENLRASILSRKKLLDSYFAMVKSTNGNQVQTIERALVDLISQIEIDEGRLHSMEAKVREALVDISFRIENRNLPAPTGQSHFAWLNHLNLTEHRGEFK